MPSVRYQWRFNGEPIPGEQLPYLILQNVQPAQAGAYDVIITNLHDACTSSPAPLVINSPLNDPGLPRIGIVPSDGQLQLHYWLQNTQGVYFILQSSVATNLWNGAPLTNATIPEVRQEQVITLDASLGPKFYTIIEDPTASLTNFIIPESSGRVATSPLGFAAQQGVPQPLAEGQIFQCTFLLADTNGAPLPINEPATLILVDGAGQPVSFSYSTDPSQVQIASGLASASVTISTTNDLTGCSLALQFSGSSPLAGAGSIIPISMPSALGYDPANPSYATNLAQAFAEYRRQNGIDTPNWGYPFAGGPRDVVGNFGEWFRAGYQFHSGIDFADAPGTQVIAAEQGVVASLVEAGPDSYIVIDHGYGYWTLYQGVYVHAPQCSVKLFSTVKKGDPISELIGGQLHFEIRTARNEAENQLTVNAMPGNALNPQLDPIFQRYLFPTPKAPSSIQKITLTPYAPSTHRYNGVSMTATPQSSPGSIYVLLQAADQQGAARLAPANITFTPSVNSGPLAPTKITLTDLDQAQLCNPMNDHRLSDRGIALYSNESASNAFSSVEKFRYWFKWDTTPYAGVRIGPRQVTLQVDDGMTNASPNLTYDFGPEIFGKQVTALSNNQYQVTIAAHLGSMTRYGRFTQPDQYALHVIDSNGRPIPGVRWQNTQTGDRSRLFTQHLQQESYTFALPEEVDPTAIHVRATSILVPDIADEVTPSFAPTNITPITNMVWIPSGAFIMGSPAYEPNRDPNEGPQTLVTLTNGFWMSRFEITQREYLEMTGTNPSYHNGDHSGPPDYELDFGVDLNRPVDWVNWQEATNYCSMLTAREQQAGHISTNDVYRLPTEAEWEYACRAGTTTAFNTGPALLSGMANFYDLWGYDAEVGTIQQDYGLFTDCTSPVGSYKPNAWGLYDMHGNVWDWVIDTLAPYAGASVTNPVVSIGSERVMRGGSFETYGYNTRTARRGHHDESYHYNFVGIRPVLIPGGASSLNY